MAERTTDVRARLESRFEGLLRAWQRYEFPVGLALIAGGFVAIGLGWYDASGTADVRRQMQSLISGGFGGLGLVIVGAILVQAQVSARGTRRLEEKLERVADAVLELAYLETPQDADRTAEITLDEVEKVVATHASYHLPGCDLLAGRQDVREMTPDEAQEQGLRRCRVCLGAAS